MTWLNKQGCSIPSFYVNSRLQHAFKEASDQISSHLITEFKCGISSAFLSPAKFAQEGRVNFWFRYYFSSSLFYRTVTCFSWKIWVLPHLLFLPQNLLHKNSWITVTYIYNIERCSVKQHPQHREWLAMLNLKIASRLTGSKRGHFVFIVTELSIIYYIETDYYSSIKVSM